ncbi:MAG: radical SAM protein [Promethearchaeota archaeon]
MSIILPKKIELLCKGVKVEKNLVNNFKFRRGRVGPFGGGYFFLENQSNYIINVPLGLNRKNASKETNLTLKRKNEHYEVVDSRNNDLFCILKEIQAPNFYELRTSEGILMNKIALVHGKDCLATTIYQKCRYWRCGYACKFCGIESGNTIIEKNYQQISEVINAAKNEGRCNHITVITGFLCEDDTVLEKYLDILKGIKNTFPELSIHVQIEPMKDLECINKLKEAGADTIGIHIEILDKLLRSMFTPGKASIPFRLYKDNWEYSIDIFGENQVETFLLCGFGENANEFIESLKKIVSIGVIPYIVPARSMPDDYFNFPAMNTDFFTEIYKRAAKMMCDFGVNPLENIAGCVRYGSCSATIEAYESIL